METNKWKNCSSLERLRRLLCSAVTRLTSSDGASRGDLQLPGGGGGGRERRRLPWLDIARKSKKCC